MNLSRGYAQIYGLHMGTLVKKGVYNFGGLLPRYPGQCVLLMFWRKGRGKITSSQPRNPFLADTALELKQEITKLFLNITEFPSDNVLQEFLDESHGLEVYMKLNKHALSERTIAFLGDAAAGMYSTLGQGVASAWERANLLAETLANTTNIDDALQDFSQKSRDQSYAITELNLVSHVREIPFLAKRLFPRQRQTIMGLAMNPDGSYVDLRKQGRLLVACARVLWWFHRVSPPVPSSPS
mmetsp:Transcript_32574/g.48223  ORF Transcript_32574/g.48223 Transcript_32574/m.48223 type:complete len:240 (+) Transcript_32574:43-762(+)